jgi:hypothetical protein
VAEKNEDRVSELERMMKDLAYAHMQTEMSLDSLCKEIRAFKEEMRGFKDEMRGFKDETRADRKSMNKQWGELANKMGTVVEDIVAPNIPRIAREYFHCEIIEDFSVTKRSQPPGPSTSMISPACPARCSTTSPSTAVTGSSPFFPPCTWTKRRYATRPGRNYTPWA